jgi:predicted secreted protein
MILHKSYSGFCGSRQELAMVPENIVRTVSLEEHFSIEQQALPGAGYMWEISQLPEGLEVISQEVVSISKTIGGYSVQRFVIVAHKTGDFSFVLELKRRWEKQSAQSEIFTIHVT